MTRLNPIALHVLANPEGTAIPTLGGGVDIDDVIRVIDIKGVAKILGHPIPTAWEVAIQLEPMMEAPCG